MFRKIALSFLIWRLVLFFLAFLSIYFLPTFGARFPYVERVLEITKLPYWLWGWGNFDGVHYLRIAQDGYLAQYSQAFFPLFPLLVRVFSFAFPKDASLNTAIYTDPAYFYSGLILANIFFLVALYVFYKLLNLDFSAKIAFFSIVFLLVFPMSFYFGAIYTESLFLLLAVSSIYLLRKKKYFWASILIGLATATRLIGVFLILVYLIEVIKNKNLKALIWLPITSVGLFVYMYYLHVNFGDPFYFLTSQPVFGAERSSGQIILLPQVIFRYIKIFLTTNVNSLTFFNALLEFFFTLVPLTLLIFLFKKMRLSYWFFTLSVLVLPTLTGTLSSMPRYALMAFLMIPYLISWLKDGKKLFFVMVISGFLAAFLVGLFIRGYWVA